MISLASSSALTDAGSTPVAANWFMRTFATVSPVAADPLEEPVAAADDEPFRQLEADLLAEPVDPRAG